MSSEQAAGGSKPENDSVIKNWMRDLPGSAYHALTTPGFSFRAGTLVDRRGLGWARHGPAETEAFCRLRYGLSVTEACNSLR